jgi:hypothetical protein
MTNSKVILRIKINTLEIDYEGEKEFLKDEVENILKNMMGVYSTHKSLMPAAPVAATKEGSAAPIIAVAGDISTNTIATIIGAKTGPDLTIAAAAALTIVQGNDRFSRKDLLTEMQTAASFFKATYRNNFSSYLDRLVKGDRLRLVGQNTFALSAAEKNALEAKIAQHQ